MTHSILIEHSKPSRCAWRVYTVWQSGSRMDIARRSFATLRISMLAALAIFAAEPLVAQRTPATPVYRAPRLADGHPDLNGIWQAFVTADWNLQDHEAA